MYLLFYFLNGPSPASIPFIFVFQKNFTIFTTIKCEKCPSFKWCWDSKPRPSEHESPPITTRPGIYILVYAKPTDSLQSFNVDVPASVVKTLVMMAGEIEYENFIYENGEALYPFTGHAMILIFTVLVSIILMNLLVGLAVSDIQVKPHSHVFNPCGKQC